AEKPRHSCRGWIGVGRAGLNAQEPNKTHAVPEPSMGEGTAEVEAPAFMPGRMSQRCVQGAQSMAKPHDPRAQDAFQDQQMVKTLIAALQEMDAKTALQGSVYALQITPL